MMLKGNCRQEGDYCNILNLTVVSLFGVVMKKMANGTVKIFEGFKMYSGVIYNFEFSEKGSSLLVLKILLPSNRMFQKKMGSYV